MDTDASYDAIPYEDAAFPETHPDALSVIAHLFNFKATPANRCRVLELGCAGGGNLIPMAWHWPGSEFVGVELSQRQATQARDVSDKLQLRNVKIIHGDILSLDQSLGKFDYIIAHGVYSWVSDSVQERLLQLCRELLQPNGIAYVSYNTLPGWNLREPIRHMMLYRARDAAGDQRVHAAMQMLEIMARSLPLPATCSMPALLKQEATQLLAMNVNYLMHDYMEPHNSPLYFHQFMERAGANHLQYLADTNLYSMFGQDQTAEFYRALDDIEDLIEFEQYLDFFTYRYFRQSLLCHTEMEFDRDAAIERMQDCQLYASFLSHNTAVNLASTGAETFTSRSGRNHTLNHPLSKAAVVLLSQAYPNGYAYAELQVQAERLVSEHGAPELAKQTDNLLRELFALYVGQGLHLSLIAREFPASVSQRPRASLLARVYSHYAKASVASVHHNAVEIDDVDRIIIGLLDGTRTLEQMALSLIQMYSERAQLREALLQKGFNRLDDVQAVAEHIQQLLYHYAAQGLLDA